MEFLDGPSSRRTATGDLEYSGGQDIDAHGLAARGQSQGFGLLPIRGSAMQGGMIRPVRGDQDNTLVRSGEIPCFHRIHSFARVLIGRLEHVAGFFHLLRVVHQ
jgi:hypothetical protein